MVKKWFWWILAGVLLLFLFLQIDINELYYSLTKIHWKIIMALLLLQILSQLLLNYQWYRIANYTNKPIPFWKMLYINSQGSIMESITPGVKVGGEIARAVQIARIGKCSSNQAAVIVALQKIFSLSAFLLINVCSVVYLSSKNAIFQTKFSQIAAYTILGTFIIFFMLIFLLPERILKWLSKKEMKKYNKLRVIQSFLKNLLEHVLLFEQQKAELIIQFILALVIWLLYPLKLYLLTSQIQSNVQLIAIGSITFFSYMIAMLPLFPGGLGGFEGTMTGLLSSIGIPLSSAATLSVIFRFITFWFVILGSLGYVTFYKMIEKYQVQKEC